MSIGEKFKGDLDSGHPKKFGHVQQSIRAIN